MSNAPCMFTNEGVRCYEPVSPKGGYCVKHQKPAYFNNRLSTGLPKNWASLVRAVLQRDKGICYRCGGVGADSADHVIPRALGGTHSLSNLRAIHAKVKPYCHDKKTEEDAQEGKRLNSNAPRRPMMMGDVRLNGF